MPTGSRHRKLAPRVASAVQREIIERDWPVGESLGSEAALIERYGVSRAVMREAVRILESRGVARMQLGPGGGLTVTAPDVASAVESVELLLDHAAVTARDLFEARSTVELTSVTLATERIDEAGIGQLRGVLQDGARLSDASELSRRFHLAVAEATGNPAIRLLVEILSSLMAKHTRSAAPTEEALEQMREAHASIVAAIVAGDSGLAQHRLRRHLAALLSPPQLGEPQQALE